MNTQVTEFKSRKGEQGNVLFLILIAVALFAALSYAVTQSTRSGGGDASNEKSLVSSAAMTQYPASLKTAIVRMMVSNGVDADSLSFDPPSDFSSLTDDTLRKANVFYPNLGGGATYVKPPSDIMATGSGEWVFNARNRVWNIGSNTADATGVDIIAILPGITKSVCDKVHSQLGMGAVPALTNVNIADPKAVKSPNTTTITYGASAIIGSDSVSTHVLNGQPQGCFTMGTNPGGSTRYIYYHVLLER
ncbi:MAG: hypothetical protein DI586_10445 [Micavibrio aeruginosavorus]|uniref:Uncharacterized protein n=1 Tax=Micavibrio aeruginosavorus TaxID=349221 RepID=A0A2W5FD36_9BACT|nr:MAG: hypothetical protein DI586_10445 [Micavibrio aeruginosavorus]